MFPILRFSETNLTWRDDINFVRKMDVFDSKKIGEIFLVLENMPIFAVRPIHLEPNITTSPILSFWILIKCHWFPFFVLVFEWVVLEFVEKFMDNSNSCAIDFGIYQKAFFKTSFCGNINQFSFISNFEFYTWIFFDYVGIVELGIYIINMPLFFSISN